MIAIAAIALVILMASPFQHPKDRYRDRNPVVVVHATEKEAEAAARADAAKKNGQSYRVTDTGSMFPVLRGGQLVVGEKTPYEELKVGDIINYKPDWNGGKVTAHRIVVRDNGGFLMSGDANPRSESRERVTPKNYVDKVVAVHEHPGVKRDDPNKRKKQ